MIVLDGKSVFGGIAIGEIAFFKRDSGVVQRKKVEDPQAEIQRFEKKYHGKFPKSFWKFLLFLSKPPESRQPRRGVPRGWAISSFC